MKKGEENFFPFFLRFVYKNGRTSILRIQDGIAMRLVYRFLIILPLTMAPFAASAISLTNRDTADRKLIVIEGDAQSERVIKVGEKLNLCEKACVIRLPDGEDYEFDGPEIVSLEEGLLFLDSPEEQGKAAR